MPFKKQLKQKIDLLHSINKCSNLLKICTYLLPIDCWQVRAQVLKSDHLGLYPPPAIICPVMVLKSSAPQALVALITIIPSQRVLQGTQCQERALHSQCLGKWQTLNKCQIYYYFFFYFCENTKMYSFFIFSILFKFYLILFYCAKNTT